MEQQNKYEDAEKGFRRSLTILQHLSGEQIEERHLPPNITSQEPSAPIDALTIPIGIPLDEVEKRVILSTLARTEYNKTRAAEVLRISLKTLHNKLKAYRESGGEQPE